MTDHPHDEIRRLFDLALDAPADERTALLDRECGDDAALKRRIAVMVSAAEDDRFLASPEEATLGVTVGLPTLESAGEQIGRYRLREQIGEGGFGTVWRAEQKEPVQREVALKIIKLGMDTREVIARFEAERQALAMMDHPHIAKVLDAGATDTGRPYFVMELVKGVPITDYCDKNSLSIEERLALFQQVCRAVQHAHQKGIIHRDIKPSNVMITVHDDTAIPKVIDFGVAKATNARLTERTVFTEHRQLIGTPKYMSPEQADPGEIDIDTRSDVYSLGVLLYELLTGTTPFDTKTLLSAGYAEIQRIIREQSPPKPSTKLSTLDTLPSVAAQRRTEPRTLSTLVRGDLDWIVMKALEKDRSRRYETANGFAADIQRYLEDQPVVASPPSASYRIHKFVRRNRTAVAAASLVVIALIVAVVGTTYGLMRALRAEQVAHHERDEATRQAAIARAVNRFLNEDLLSAAEPSIEAGRGHDVRVREVLDQAARRIDEAAGPGGRFENQPLVEAAIRETIATTYRRLGQHRDAGPQAERALQLRRRTLGANEASTIDVLAELATIQWRQGRYDKAARTCDDVVARRRELLGEDHRQTLRALSLRAHIEMDRGRWSEAEALLDDVLERQRRTLGERHAETLRTQNALALVYQRQSRFDEATRLYQQTLAAQERALGESHPDTLVTMRDLAGVYIGEERYSEAEPLLTRTLRLQQRVFGDEHPRTLTTRRDLAATWSGLRRFDEAEAALEELVEIRRRVSGPDHPETAMLAAVLGLARRDQDSLGSGDIDLAAAVEAQRTALGTAHPTTIISMAQLADAYARRDRFDVALPLAREVADEARRVLGPRHKWTLKALWTLGSCYRKLGRFDDAEAVLQEVLQSRRAVFGDDAPATVHGIANIALLRQDQGRVEEAEELMRQAVEGFRRVLPADDPRALTHEHMRGLILIEMGRRDEAERILASVIEEMRDLLGPNHPDTLLARNNRGRLAFERQDVAAAETEWLDVLERRRRTLGPLHPKTIETVEDLLRLWRDDRQPVKATELITETLAAEPRTAMERNSLAWLLLTCEPVRLQEPARALQLIRRANEDTGYKNPHFLDTLAAALHRTGALREAVETQRRALEYAPFLSREEYRERLATYEAALAEEGR